MSDPDNQSVLFQRGVGRLPRRHIETFAEELQHQVANGRRFYCLIATDAELRRLNREFLGKDYPTDVLSFPSGARHGILGELAISADRARDQARDHRHSVFDEIRILMLHGVLHLLGLDHESDRGRMAKTEARWRVQYGLPAGLIERASL